MTSQEMKDWIEHASYEELLRKWRFAPPGDPFFADDVGVHYSWMLRIRKSELLPEEQVRISKKVGFDANIV